MTRLMSTGLVTLAAIAFAACSSGSSVPATPSNTNARTPDYRIVSSDGMTGMPMRLSLSAYAADPLHALGAVVVGGAIASYILIRADLSACNGIVGNVYVSEIGTTGPPGLGVNAYSPGQFIAPARIGPCNATVKNGPESVTVAIEVTP